MSDKAYMSIIAAATIAGGVVFAGGMFLACTKMLEIFLAGA